MPGGLGGSGSLLAGGGGGTENLPGSEGGTGALLAGGKLIGIVVRDSSLSAGFVGRFRGIVARFASDWEGRSMRMVSRLAPVAAWEGRLMRMVSFFASPIRTVSFFTPGVCGRVMRMVSFFASPDAPGFGGRVIRTVAFLGRLGSGDAAGGVSAAIVSFICIASQTRGVNPWFQEICQKSSELLLARLFPDL